MSTLVQMSMDDIMQLTPVGSLDKAIGNNLYGINHLQTPGVVPSNRDQPGFLFFTRPQLNLQLDNVRNDRKFMPLGSDLNYRLDRNGNVASTRDGSTSIHRFIRTTLDPRLMVGYQYNTSPGGTGSGTSIAPITCPLTNNNMAWIPVLTNNVISASGFPDPIVPTWSSRPGRYNESVSLVDGLVQNYESYSVDVTFRNTMADPILYMFYIWAYYMSNVFMGKMVPYPDFIVDRRLDYNTRIFRVRLDRNRYRVTKIMSTGPAIPVASSVGQFGDLIPSEVLHASANKDIGMRFQCTGFEIFDDILVYEFNAITAMFKSEMKDDFRDDTMQLLPRSISYLFQNRAYPRINPDTHVMEWWVDKDLFDLRTRIILTALGQDEDAALDDTSNIENEEGI